METQPTQYGLMQIFTNLGLATDNSLTTLEGQNPDGKGFASLLSEYLAGDSENPLESISSNLLSLQVMEQPNTDLLNSDILADEGLPLLGQTLPLETIIPSIEPSIELSAEPLNVLTAEEASIMASSPALSEVAFYKGSLKPANTGVIENDSATQTLAEQGFHAQSLVSSLIDNRAVSSVRSGGEDASAAAMPNSIPSSTSESLNTAHMLPQQVGKGINSQKLTASDLDAISDEAADRFLGSEPVLSPLKSKKSVAIDLLPAAQGSVVLNSPSAFESQVSLALALNEDPTTQSLAELIDGKALEQVELETKLTTLERKQDDQTLKLSKGQQAWGDAITERITINAAKDIRQVTIHLDPPELGSLELKLQVKEDQQTHVQVQVHNPQVKEALESSAHRLREMLAGQGLELAEFDVQADSGQGEQTAYGGDEQGEEPSQDSDTSLDSGDDIRLEIPKSKNNNLLDTFV